ncbi:hypothetical protein BDU57DRAFT_559940 [Ampelomyces quisqualis]|uniref:Uncharacterized protein n=1 Tax=Ampelomyces quisqualis TaxID=50730 RepID=A0A6A5Q976_AMPQU|nr:hypothetical protein BDU57DRAFT_559940 [Ampelomyces quisqualis]
MPRKPGSGRLNRISSSTEPRRVHLARPRGNIWELPASPEKSQSTSQGTVHRGSLKNTRKNRADAPSEDHELPSDLPPLQQGEDGDEPGLYENVDIDDHEAPSRASPPRVVQALEDSIENDVQIEEFTSKGAIRCAQVSYRSDKPAGPRYEQCHNAARKESTNHGPRCSRHLQNPGTVRCGHMLDQDGQEMQCLVPGLKGSNRCLRHAKLEDPALKASRKRKSAEEQHAESRRSKSPKLQKPAKVGSTVQAKKASDTGERQEARKSLIKFHPEVRMPAHKNKSRKHGQPGSKLTASDLPAQEDVAESVEAVASPTSFRRTRSKPQSSNVRTSRLRRGTLLKHSNPTKATKPLKASHLDAEHSSDDGQHENSQDHEDEEEEDSDEAELLQEEASADDVYIPKPLRRVFEFLGLEKRPGTCQTERCRDIKSICDKTRSLFRKQKLSLKEVNRKTEAVQAMLRTVGTVPKDDHGAVKADVYAYVFRSLSKLLVSLYEYFAERDGDFTESLRHMRILFPFVHDIVALKDLLSSWNATVPQRYRGDRLIADVNSLLIAPLRDLETLLNKRLSQLEQNERDIEKLAALEQQIEEEDMEAARRQEAAQARIKRRDRWLNLHVARMLCEPDVDRRLPYLKFIEPENLEEKDANGVVFERVPMFKDRNSTPSRCSRSTRGPRRSWSDKQVEALIDSLKKFAGPDVFDNVFDSDCRPGGPLRDFNVTDITDKAAWIRSSYIKLHEERNWEVPEWMKQIPVLP